MESKSYPNHPNIKEALFAGGCFWCMAKPYYEYDGVIKVISGFAGGFIKNPTYEEVKQGNTGHKETIKIIYDANKISFSELLEIYLNSIDPFDNGGQYIDRGDNYTCAIFTSDDEEKNLVLKRINQIEKEFQQKVYLELLDKTTFYEASDEHQDYALKNPEKMALEWEKSGRK